MVRKPCTKKRHASEQAARDFQAGMEPWFCGQCKAWHLTSGMLGRLNRAKLAATPHAAAEWIRRRLHRRR